MADLHAATELDRIIAASAELFPLQLNEKTEYFLLNVCPVYDCLDRERTDFVPLPSGRVMYITRYEFIVDALPKQSLFKSTMRRGEIYATQGHLPAQDEFKAEVERLNLTGLEFREIWNDDGGYIEPQEAL